MKNKSNKLGNIDEKVLWDKVLRGDMEAYKTVYEKYVDSLFKSGRQYSNDFDLIKDCIQDIFINIHRNRGKLSHVDNVKSYLFVSMRNCIYNSMKRMSLFRKFKMMERAKYQAQPTQEDAMLTKERTDDFHNLFENYVSRLSPRQREAIFYRYIENMSVKEISTIMKMNNQSVQNLLQRSIKKMRIIMDQQ